MKKTNSEEPRREIRFDAKFAAVLDQFKATNDVRYYLNGVYVSPHPDSGVILAATDGHTMVIIHDPEGFCDSDQIFPLSKPLVSAAKKRIKSHGKPAVVELIGEAAFVRMFRPDEFSAEISGNDIYVEHNKPVDGKYPDLTRIIHDKKPKPSLIALNSAYCSRIEKACAALGQSKWPGSVWYTFGEDDGMIVELATPGKEDVKVIIMPMKHDLKAEKVFSDSMLSWANSKKKEKTNENK